MLVSTDAARAPANRVWGVVREQRSNDVVAHANSLSSWQQQYDQLAGGAFRGALDELWFEDVQVFRERTSHAVRQVCRIREDAVWCGVTIRHDGSRIEGLDVGYDGVMVCGHSAPFELLTPDSHEILGIVASRQALLDHAEAAGVALDTGLLDHATWIACGTRPQSRLRDCLGLLLHLVPPAGIAVAGTTAAPAGNAAQGAGRAHRRAEQAALDALFEVLVTPSRRAGDMIERTGFERRRQLVRRVSAHVQDCGGEIPTVPDLCATFHVSRRTLQYAFEQVVGSSPVAYLRGLRLNAVRRDLVAGDAPTVHDAAARQGFWSLSQFASDYRGLFGERPSETLARARRLP